LQFGGTHAVPTHVFYTYSPAALTYDSATDQFTLSSSYDWRTDRYRIELSDDDNFADGDLSNNEVGEDANQTATVYDGNGNIIASGPIYVEQYGQLEQTGGGTFHNIDRFEIGGQHMGYVPSTPLTPGTTYDYIGGGDVDDTNGGGFDNRMTYDYYEDSSVPCFGPGTLIATDRGEVPVDWLGIDECVMTRDNGPQPIVWIARHILTPRFLDRFPHRRPIRFQPGALGAGLPVRALEVTADHRILIHSPAAQLCFGADEVFAPAKVWAGRRGAELFAPPDAYTVTHLLCRDHQVICAEGAWVETLLLGPEAQKSLDTADLAAATALLGADGRHIRAARPCLSVKEAAMILALQDRSPPLKLAG